MQLHAAVARLHVDPSAGWPPRTARSPQAGFVRSECSLSAPVLYGVDVPAHVAASTLRLPHDVFQSASMRAAVSGCVDRMPPLSGPDVCSSHVSVLIIISFG
jgi:hypothetical protein